MTRFRGSNTTEAVKVRFQNDLWQRERVPERTDATITRELSRLFAFARSWAAQENRPDGRDLTFSALLAAMVADDQPLCRWLRQYFDRLAVPSSAITKGRSCASTELYPPDREYLGTTISFRKAFNKAESLRSEISPGLPVDVRHFMAAYAISPNYHLRDFRRYRIDRREWCLTLAGHLGRTIPDEASHWASYAESAPPLLPLAFENDTPEGWDRLHLEREVTAFSHLIAARSTATPLSIGVFGSWGSGKTFFMRRTRERVAALAAEAARDPQSSEHHSRIAQVEFNAWHYSETDLIASLVDHVFRNLRIDAIDEDEAILNRRATEIIALLDAAKRGVVNADQTVADASARLRSADEDLRQIEADLPEAVGSAHHALTEAEDGERRAGAALRREQVELERDLTNARAIATGTTLLSLVADANTTQAVRSTASALVELTTHAAETRRRWKAIGLGIVLAVATAGFALLAGTNTWSGVLAAVTGIGTLVAMAKPFFRALNDLATRGQDFEEARERAAATAIAQVSERHADMIATLEADLKDKKTATSEALRHLNEVGDSRDATNVVRERRGELDNARRHRAEVQSEVDRLDADLERTSMDTLLSEFLEERNAADRYRAHLGIFSQVRDDFERLSKLMTKATAAHYERGGPPPALSRIVLYIDDLDRCPEDKVIEVLRAVHLLLAFPLFVCVAAVDPRWLTTCLRNAPGVRQRIRQRAPTDADATTEQGRPPAVFDDVDGVVGRAADVHDTATASDGRTATEGVVDDQFGRSADPADYIEKVFQVPLWLRPVPEALRPALLRSWLQTADERARDHQPRKSDAERPAIDPLTETTEAEMAFLDDLAPFLPGKPRTLKRLANTYRFVKNAISDVEYQTFTSGEATTAPYRVCLTQLAILCGDRTRALRMIGSLEREGNVGMPKSFNDWLATLDESDSALAAFLRNTFSDALSIQEFQDWLDRTRRYSFYL